MFNAEQKKELLKIARTVIEDRVKTGSVPVIQTYDPALKINGGAFVTLHIKGRLRGCIGLIEAVEPLYMTVQSMAVESALHDPRFTPVRENELPEIDIEISALSPKKRIKSIDEIELGKHGVIVKRGFAGGVFLPQVADETGWTKAEFMEHLCADKAGLAKDEYLDPKTEIYIFEADVFGEKNLK